MSQMPDKIWLHKDTKYSTGDIVSAYQYEFAQEIECEGIENFVEYVPVDAFIEKVEKWLNKELHIRFSGNEYFVASNKGINLQEFIKNFKDYMKEE